MQGEISTSVVIPTRNRRRLLQIAIASIRGQEVAARECIVVNDGSEDDTHRFLRTIEGPGLLVHSVSRSVGRSAARNIGLQCASSDAVLFLDDDDVLEPTAIGVLSNALRNNPAAICAIGGRIDFDSAGHRRRVACTHSAAVRHVWPEVLAGWYAVPGQCLFRTLALRSVGGWDEQLSVAEDQDLLLRTSRLGPTVLLRDTVLGYRIHGPGRHPPAERIERDIRERYLNGLDYREQVAARPFVTAWEQLTAAGDEYRCGEYQAAVVSLRAATTAAPNRLDSPIPSRYLGLMSMTCRAGAMLGTRLSLVARRIGRFVRKSARRDPHSN
jgi:glycosyltransferase involved in cell wall biosynthesis